MRRQKTFTTEHKCQECNAITTIHRKMAKRKERGHIKHMYCYRCHDTTAHAELGNSEVYGWREVF